MKPLLQRLGPRRRRVEREFARIEEAYELTVAALAAALELRDDETGAHTKRVTEIALALTRAVDPVLAASPELRYGFLLHDIGKIGIPDAVLLKPGPLSEEEERQLHVHPVLGEHLVSSIPYLSGVAREVIAYHHERWDGSGYPWAYEATGSHSPPGSSRSQTPTTPSRPHARTRRPAARRKHGRR